jgi:hypothetical protein
MSKLRRAREREMQVMLEARYNYHVFDACDQLKIPHVYPRDQVEEGEGDADADDA